MPAAGRDAARPGTAVARFVLLRVVPLAIVLALWQAVSTWAISPVYLPAPVSIAARVGSWLANGYLLHNCYTTLEETISGFVLGVVAGALAGIALGMSRWWSGLLSPYINALYALPKVALGPLFILWFGIGLSMKIAMVGIFVFFVVFYNTWQGVKEVDAKLIQAMRLLRASRLQMVLKLIVPSALGWIFVGIRVSFPLALVGAIVGELIASNSGIGYVILNAANTFDTVGLFAGLFAVMVIAVVFDVALTYVYGRYTRRWALQIKGVTALS
ncbi:ABC transporter permease [Rugosimonospora acidiphila]|uniref:ABC transporter permease n=1 Tax=Rugosimonospora acidiphila TaxID=556531 RepID=A0ABP9SRM6_9ACTN